jgi:hypothetical protein
MGWCSPLWPSTNSEKARGIPDRVIHYQYRHGRARKTLRGIDEQVAKAQRAVDGHAPVKRNHYIQLSGATKSVNRTLEAKSRAVAGWKGYPTNLVSQPATFINDAYHQLWAHRESLPDVQARPTGPPDLPPQTRIHRSTPHRRVRCHGRQPPKPVGASRNSSGPHAATAPCRSKPAAKS